MSTELWIAIVGVGGTLLASATIQILQVLDASRKRSWQLEDAKHVWEAEREARLFDSRREAHEKFYRLANAWHALEAPRSRLPYPRRARQQAEKNLAPESIEMFPIFVYASPVAAECAKEYLAAIHRLSESSEADKKRLDRDVDAYEQAYVEAMRRDLGIVT